MLHSVSGAVGSEADSLSTDARPGFPEPAFSMAASQSLAKAMWVQSQMLTQRILQPPGGGGSAVPWAGQFCGVVMNVISEIMNGSAFLLSFQLFYKHEMPVWNPLMLKLGRAFSALEP